jgi:hypothetical protein
MRISQTLAATGLMLTVVACGSKSGSSPAPSDTPAPADTPAPVSDADKAKLDAEFAQLPNAAIVRVPVDANGNATGQPEMHAYSGTATLNDSSSAAAAFDAGKAPTKLVSSASELDGDTSTQSWSGWQNWNNASSYYNNSGYTGQGTYGNTYGYGSTYSSTYQPTYSSTYQPTYSSTYQPTYQPYQPSYNTTTAYSNSTPTPYCNDYCGGWNNNYFQNTYQPTLYWQGQGWNYNYANQGSYTSNGYSYYCYTPHKYW